MLHFLLHGQILWSSANYKICAFEHRHLSSIFHSIDSGKRTNESARRWSGNKDWPFIKYDPFTSTSLTVIYCSVCKLSLIYRKKELLLQLSVQYATNKSSSLWYPSTSSNIQMQLNSINSSCLRNWLGSCLWRDLFVCEVCNSLRKFRLP